MVDRRTLPALGWHYELELQPPEHDGWRAAAAPDERTRPRHDVHHDVRPSSRVSTREGPLYAERLPARGAERGARAFRPHVQRRSAPRHLRVGEGDRALREARLSRVQDLPDLRSFRSTRRTPVPDLREADRARHAHAGSHGLDAMPQRTDEVPAALPARRRGGALS